jgi:hypothetical protein
MTLINSSLWVRALPVGLSVESTTTPLHPTLHFCPLASCIFSYREKTNLAAELQRLNHDFFFKKRGTPPLQSLVIFSFFGFGGAAAPFSF